ncbi:MAG TPA: hypothetical protein VJH22_02655 [Candidatus Nanoarchaeia archaeon]|nr:hypothetical protein [Candidatus Nanoarchaeia archaeon]
MPQSVSIQKPQTKARGDMTFVEEIERGLQDVLQGRVTEKKKPRY